MIYTLWLDDLSHSEESRIDIRRRLDEALDQPLNPEAAGEQGHEEWGTSPEAIAEGERAQAMLGDAAQEGG